jgi:NADH-ubiquinone oxidoreductase chain 1
LFFSIFSLSVYFFLFCGFGGNSKYSLVGAYRGVSQTISYEVSIIVFVLFLVYFICLFDFYDFAFFQERYWLCFFFPQLFFCWIFVCLAESNRTPFDFSEGESELVSGFNVEYGGGLFSIIFICEYGFLILLGFLRTVFFLGGSFFFLKRFFFFFFFLWVRVSLPRYRYDKLMFFA